ncbi:MAG: riboflavin synthase subunit alpha [Alphaproteobacteria bacterium]|nr:MAG: riboflavin synthase subunit alpha [Alphaproteobacteria bacterium]
MFTGIVTDLGRVRSVIPGGVTRLVLETGYDTATLDHGASVCCNGVCLSVVDKGPGWFAVEASNETLACTTVGAWQPGRPVNFERALKIGDELGGHVVSGHVDGVGTVVERRQDGDSWRFAFEAPDEVADFVAPKGSIAVDGVSLTVNEVAGNRFGVNIIPVTRDQTTFGSLHMGDRVNLEIDPLARYVARLMERKRA